MIKLVVVKRLLVIHLSLVIALSAIGEPKKDKSGVDEESVQTTLSEMSDVDKIDEFIRLAKANRKSNRKSAIQYAEQGGALATKLGKYRKAYDAYYLLGQIQQDKANILQPKAAISAFELAAKSAELNGYKTGLMAAYKKLAEEYAHLNNSKTSLMYYEKYSDLEENKIELRAQKLSESLVETQKHVEQKDNQISTLEVEKTETLNLLDSVSKEKLVAQLENERMQVVLADERNKRNVLLGGVIVIALVLGFLLFAFFQNKKSTSRLAAKNVLIEIERSKSDELLLNILPKPVANELKEHGKTTPQHFEEVTVLFTDIQSFTKISEKLSPIELVNEIDFCFRGFDRIISKYDIEKIKTIGDAYMCASGLPVANGHHCNEILDAALEIRDFVKKLAEKRRKENRPSFEMRIGVHTGPLVAGVVGSTKFVYDVWGDTVNTAARMEQNGEAGKVNVSAEVHKRAKDDFEFTYRGKLEAKNKGALDMYFLGDRKKPKEKANIDVNETTISTS